MSEAIQEFDVVVVGAGSGGYAAARGTSAAGLKTAIIEGASEVGGLCILRGCMPTKALLYAAEVRHLARHAETWGMKPLKVPFDLEAVMARMNAMIEDFAGYRRKQLETGSFEFIRAHATFESNYVLALDNGTRLHAKHIVLATGSCVAPPPMPALDAVGYLTSDDALLLKKLPRSLIVLGGGAVGLEFAQFFARFDVEVTVIQRSPHVLREFDVDASIAVETAFAAEGIKVYTDTELLTARCVGHKKEVEFLQNGEKVTVKADEIFFGLGRVPNTRCLGLEFTSVQLERERIITNARMQTSVPHIYAIGDCTGPYEIVHIAIQQAEIAAHNIAHAHGARREIDYSLLLSVVFTDPAVASVGLTEYEAKRQNIPYLVASYPFADHGKSMIMEALHGFVKLLADPATGRILGGSCVGPQAGDLIHEIVAAMRGRLTAAELAAMPHYHPTLAEIWAYPAEELAGQAPPQLAG